MRQALQSTVNKLVILLARSPGIYAIISPVCFIATGLHHPRVIFSRVLTLTPLSTLRLLLRILGFISLVF